MCGWMVEAAAVAAAVVVVTTCTLRNFPIRKQYWIGSNGIVHACLKLRRNTMPSLQPHRRRRLYRRPPQTTTPPPPPLHRHNNYYHYGSHVGFNIFYKCYVKRCPGRCHHPWTSLRSLRVPILEVLATMFTILQWIPPWSVT